MDPATGRLPDELQDQVRLMFNNLTRILAAAGGSLDDVARVTVFVKTAEARPAVNVEWVKRFPDPASRPARHTLQNDSLPGNMLVQCDAIAFITPKAGA
jgi:enamine deaminase RidA (YjgF/YER057c/UK114 family)